jgi:rfaE bifunctional protein nucleotidyltransferase chain/domain
MGKIYKSLKSLSFFLNKQKKKKIGLCHGCFDIVHWGHILHFASSKRKCDILIVTVTADKYVNKGLNRPIFSDKERAMLLSGIKYIDGVYINSKNHSVSILEKIKPNFYFKGKEYRSRNKKINNNFFLEKNAAKKNNIKIIYTNDRTSSTTMVVNKLYNASVKNKN